MTHTHNVGAGAKGRDAQWERYRDAIRAEVLPCALIDMDAFDHNVKAVLAPLKEGKKRLRIATKSLRCPELVERVIDHAGALAAGLMTYTAAETAFWAQRGQKDLLLAYPTVRPSDLSLLVAAHRAQAAPAAVIDCEDHLAALERAAAQAGIRQRFVVELDVAYRPWKALHLGTRRSPLHAPEEALALVRHADRHAHLEFHGVMAYEAQIAGVADSGPQVGWTAPVIRWMKRRSRPDVASARRRLVEALTAEDRRPEVVNGGGSGDLSWAAHDPTLTEVTAGSAFLGGHLLDSFRDLHAEPAAFFAVQVSRRPAPGILTCNGGGFVASGSAGADRLPLPALPDGLRLLPREGAGEVQTPVVGRPDLGLALGDPVFFRHAKAGELAEHVKEYLLVRGNRIEARVPTYRGLGECFGG
ncbi:MAG TPA: alanine racemase [Polyangiaceae bacterium]|nr:alanine racemase [Polyangiaceae bacterium]